MPRMITPIILVHHNHHHHHHDHHALLLVHQDGITSYLQTAGRQVSTAGQWIWIEEVRCIEGRDKSAYDGDKDGSGDNASECKFLTNPGLQGSTEACKAIVLAPTRRTKTPATLWWRNWISVKLWVQELDGRLDKENNKKCKTLMIEEWWRLQW